jgi:hypothetical protein
LFALFGAGACVGEDQDTCGKENDEISAVAIVVDRGDVLRAEIDFEAGDRSGEAAPLFVCGDERLRINGDSPIETEKADRIIYAANLGAEDRTVSFSLTRPEGDVSLSIDVPDPFDIVAPAEGAELSRAADAVVEWTPPVADRTMRIELGEEIGGGICIYTTDGEHDYKDRGGVDVDDGPGTWTIPAGTVAADGGGPCGAHYTLKRIAQGEYTSALSAGGYVEARVERTVTFVSTP